MLRNFALAVSLACTASLAWGDIVPVPEFTGMATETFEHVLSGGAHPGPIDILGGKCSMDDQLAHTVVIAWDWMGPGGTVFPRAGIWMGGTVAGPMLLQFDTPITDFGTFVNTVSSASGGTAAFYDPAGTLIDTLPLSVTPATWTWQGWHSNKPVSSIILTGNSGPGWGLILDQTQVNWVVPEPASLSLLAIAGLLAIRRR